MGIFSSPARDEQGQELKRRKSDQIPFSIIASDMTVIGDLETLEAVIAGQVKGAIHARERVELQATAMVAGDILTPRISIIEGGRVTGEVKMDSKTEAHVVGTSHNS
jgi:cytoskeletal protein CcmA (bactofilin family)